MHYVPNQAMILCTALGKCSMHLLRQVQCVPSDYMYLHSTYMTIVQYVPLLLLTDWLLILLHALWDCGQRAQAAVWTPPTPPVATRARQPAMAIAMTAVRGQSTQSAL